MNHLQKAIQSSRQVYWVYARPLDTMDQQFHCTRLSEVERLHAHRLDCGEGRREALPRPHHAEEAAQASFF